MELKTEVKPHAKHKCSRKTNDLPWAFMKALKCGAKTRKGIPCMAPAMKNGRCRLHGGKSTGPKTSEGIERIKQAHFKHGQFAKDTIAARKEFNAILRKYRQTLKGINKQENSKT